MTVYTKEESPKLLGLFLDTFYDGRTLFVVYAVDRQYTDSGTGDVEVLPADRVKVIGSRGSHARID